MGMPSSGRALSRRVVVRAAVGGAALAMSGGPGAWVGLLSTSLPQRAGVVAELQSRVPTWFGLEGPGIISSFASTDEVVLTFDACGGSRLAVDSQLIEVLRRHRAPATLFVNRSWAVHNWRVLRELVADPLFEIANHGDRHVPLSVAGQQAYGITGTRTVGEAYDEIARTQLLLHRMWDVEPRWFRPGTAHLDDVGAELAARLGTPAVGFTVNGDLGATSSAAEVTAALLTVQPGGIVLAHMNHPGGGTAAGVDAALPQLIGRGLRLRRLADVL